MLGHNPMGRRGVLGALALQENHQAISCNGQRLAVNPLNHRR